MIRLYLFLAILGALLPYLFFIQFFSTRGFALGGFLPALFANGAASGFTVGPLFTSFVFWLYMFVRKGKDDGPSPVLFIVRNLLIGLSCALPAYLYAIGSRGALQAPNT